MAGDGRVGGLSRPAGCEPRRRGLTCAGESDERRGHGDHLGQRRTEGGRRRRREQALLGGTTYRGIAEQELSPAEERFERRRRTTGLFLAPLVTAVLEPARFDVIVASNLFGDILSDVTAAVAGSIGIAPSANLDPTHTYPSMFEPVHGSAPDIAGKALANPVGAVWSAALMLEHLGHEAAGADMLRAIETCMRDPTTRTPDLGGEATTDEVKKRLVDLVG